jgi:murein DD-endopeptidase MepM/ murein hydrolase activator NlpD
MKRRQRHRQAWVLSVLGALGAGTVGGWWLHAAFSSSPSSLTAPLREVISSRRTTRAGGEERHPSPPVPTIGGDPVAELRRRRLKLPIDRASIDAMKGNFAQPRGGGSRVHEAVDIMAPRNSPIHAVEAGTIARLFLSRTGGLTVYQFDPTRKYTYYYAHLERYADGLKEGQPVEVGQVIGYVGTSGNAPPNAPHLHFAIFEMTNEKQWWNGRPVDPYEVFRGVR